MYGEMGRILLDGLVPETVCSGFERGVMNNAAVFCMGAMFMLWFGSLLPDIDSKRSMLGRYFHLPFKHRTWTHSIWPLAILMLAASATPWLAYAFFGYAMHLLCDAVSSAGICWAYPFTRYIVYPNGAFVAPGHRVKLYRSGEASETCFMLIATTACVLVCIFTRGGFAYLFDWIVY